MRFLRTWKHKVLVSAVYLLVSCVPLLVSTNLAWAEAPVAGIAPSCVKLFAPNGTADHLDQSTFRISEVSIVVPIYRELSNGNIARVIHSFMQQQTRNGAEIIFVVNNTPELAAEKNHPAYLENQKTLAILKAIETNSPLPTEALSELPQWDQQVFRKAKNQNLRIRAVDLSSKGVPKNIGAIRNVGVRLAQQSFLKGGPDRIIAMLDADTTIPSNYVRSLYGHFNNPDVSSVFFNIDFRLGQGGEDPLMVQTTYHNAYEFEWMTFVAVAFQEKLSNLGGPQIAGLASAFQKINGVPRLQMGEDWALANALNREGHAQFAYDITVTTADRARADGFNASSRLKAIEDVRDQQDVAERLRLNTNIKDAPLGSDPKELFVEHSDPALSPLLARVFELYAKDILRETWFSKHLRSDIASNELSVLARQYVEIKKADEAERTRLVKYTRKMIENLLAGVDAGQGLSATYRRDYFWVEPNIRKTMQEETAGGRATTPEAILSKMVWKFPNFYEPLEASSARYLMKSLGAISRFFQQARSQPEQFPSTMAFLKKLPELWMGNGDSP